MFLHPYVWLKFLHVLSAAVLLGTGAGSAFQIWSAHRNGSMRGIAIVFRTALKTDRRFLLPAVAVLLVTGLGLVVVTRTPIDASWLTASYIFILIAAGFWLWAASLQRAANPHAQESSNTGVPVRYAYHEAMKRWFVIIWPAFGALLVVFFLMTIKPTMW